MVNVNRPERPKPRVRLCNACRSANAKPHCPAPKHCAWIVCTDCGKASDNYGHHIDYRKV